MSTAPPGASTWRVGLMLIGPGNSEGPDRLVRTFDLFLDSDGNLCVQRSGITDDLTEPHQLGRLHVHPGAWPMALHEHRLEHARYAVWVEDLGDPPLRLCVDAYDDLDTARAAGTAAAEALTSAGDVPGLYVIIDRWSPPPQLPIM